MATCEMNGVAVGDSSTQKSVEANDYKHSFTLEILKIIKDSQQQHGLRHGDYQRYKGYCSRRLRRIRKSLHFVQGTKHRFQPKKVTEETLNDVRYLHIPLITAERAWSYAMQLKQEANTEPRKRFHVVSRLRKATLQADNLEQLCQSTKCDARTKLEAQAFAAWIRGSLHFELQEWQPAIESFRKAQTIYERLSQALNEDEQLLYRQRVEELTPNIRYCAYNIGDESAINDLMQIRLASKVGGKDILAADLDNLIAQTREKQANTLSEVSWLGRTVPVRQEKVRLFLLNVQESKAEIMKASNVEAKIAVYEQLLMECKDALQVLRDEMKLEQAKGFTQSSEGSVSSLSYLHSYLLYLRLNNTIERNLLLIESLKDNLHTAETAPEGKKSSKPQDLIRPYEIIIQNLNEMSQIGGISSDSIFLEEIQTQILAFKAHRCYYIAQAFASANKWTEAIALYHRAEEYLQSALKSRHNKKLKSSLDDLQNHIEGCKYTAHALSILGADQALDQMEQLTLKDGKILADRLEKYYEDPKLTSCQPNIAKFPPDFEPIPCKPLFFDLALNHIEFPPLDDRVEQKKGGGITGFMKGWLGWKK